MRLSRLRDKGFTLTELLASVAIIAVLSALALGGWRKARDQAVMATDAANMRQVGAALMAYVGENNGTLPGPMYVVQAPRYAYWSPTSRSWNLAEFLAVYLGLPAPTGTYQTAKPLVSAGYLNNPQGANKKAIREWRVNYMVNDRRDLFSWKYPFGKVEGNGVVTQEPLRHSMVNQTVNLSEAWALCSADAQLSSLAGNSSCAPQPYHRDYRHFLFFDGHVEARSKDIQP